VESYKWPAALIGAVLAYKSQPFGVIALSVLWPLAAAILIIPGKIGMMEQQFARATLDFWAAKAPPEE
jgi:hypothetical protein